MLLDQSQWGSDGQTQCSTCSTSNASPRLDWRQQKQALEMNVFPLLWNDYVPKSHLFSRESTFLPQLNCGWLIRHTGTHLLNIPAFSSYLPQSQEVDFGERSSQILGSQFLGSRSNRHYTAGNSNSKRCCGESIISLSCTCLMPALLFAAYPVNI